MSQLNIIRFDASQYCNHDLNNKLPRTLIIGIAESGKTTISKQILKELNPNIQIMNAYTKKPFRANSCDFE
jgi:predicted AAA+ superfamily ATPase